MSFTIIRANTMASLSRNVLAKVSLRAAKGLLALSSGKRINSSEDDASGYSMARGMEARRRGLRQALANINNVESLLNIAAGTYSVINEGMMKLKELLMQGADDSYAAPQRAAIQGQIDAIVAEVDDTVKSSTYQGTKLLDGSFTGKRFQVGEEAGDILVVNLDDVRSATLGLTGLDVSSNATASVGLTAIDAALQNLLDAMQSTGEVLMRINSKQDITREMLVSIEATRSRIEDVDFAKEQMTMARINLLRELGFVSMKEAVVAPQQVLSLFAQ